MKILKANAGPLTNFEVLDLLQSRGASKDPTRVMSLITPSEFKVYDYLIESAACNQTRECIKQFQEKSKEFQLAKAEIINMINIRPASAAEIAPIIESLEERQLDEEKLAEMVVQVLPPRRNQENADGEAPENDGEEEAQEDDGEEEAQEDDGEEEAQEENVEEEAHKDDAEETDAS